MKKLIALLLAALMIAALCACGQNAPEVTEEQVPQSTEAAPVEDTQASEEPTEEVTEVAAASAFELAESCIDKSLEELYQLIGEPESADYAPSCLNPGVGEDGNLYYDGFTVYTYREGDTETVTYVE